MRSARNEHCARPAPRPAGAPAVRQGLRRVVAGPGSDRVRRGRLKMRDWTIGIAALLLVVVLATIGMLAVRWIVSLPVLESHTAVAGHIYSVVGAVYGVLVAFVVVVAWERHEEARRWAEREANAAADLDRYAVAFPPEARDRFQAELRAYAKEVIEDEWPAMARGVARHRAWRAYDRLWAAYTSYEPTTETERIWFDASVNRLTDLGDHRRLRLLSGRNQVPGALWVVLLAGGVIVVGFSYLFGARSTWSQVLMTSSLATSVALVLLLLAALQQPYRGVAAVEPEAMRQLLESMEDDAPAGAAGDAYQEDLQRGARSAPAAISARAPARPERAYARYNLLSNTRARAGTAVRNQDPGAVGDRRPVVGAPARESASPAIR